MAAIHGECHGDKHLGKFAPQSTFMIAIGDVLIQMEFNSTTQKNPLTTRFN